LRLRRLRSSAALLTALGILVTSVVAICAPNEAAAPEGYESYPAEPGPGGRLAVTVHPGEEWIHTLRVMLVVPVKNRPQMAFWIEKPDGEFVTTISVTRRAAFLDWRAAPGEDADAIERPSALPAWTHRHERIGIAPMKTCSFCHGEHGADEPRTELPPDAVTSATPKAGFVREWAVPKRLEPGTYVVRAEVNHSTDFNDTYSDDAAKDDPFYSGGSMGSGQPSLIWSGEIKIGNEPASVSLEPTGHGHPAGRDGSIDPDLSGLTTALSIVEGIEVNYTPSGEQE